MYAYEKQPDGVLFEIKKKNNEDPKWVKIQVCADNIIRVIATPADTFSTRKSLMVSHDDWSKTEWSVKEAGNDVEIITSRITVKVNQENGVVAFYDQQGKQLLQEKKQGGKIITSAVVLGEKTYHIQQLFESPADEAFYGLGAHQNGVMNYKGHDADLWQYNIVDVNPFLISSNNFGILWDNNSKTKIGDIREYESISGLLLYGKDGRKGGLTAEYFIDKNFNAFCNRFYGFTVTGRNRDSWCHIRLYWRCLSFGRRKNAGCDGRFTFSSWECKEKYVSRNILQPVAAQDNSQFLC